MHGGKWNEGAAGDRKMEREGERIWVKTVGRGMKE